MKIQFHSYATFFILCCFTTQLSASETDRGMCIDLDAEVTDLFSMTTHNDSAQLMAAKAYAETIRPITDALCFFIAQEKPTLDSKSELATAFFHHRRLLRMDKALQEFVHGMCNKFANIALTHCLELANWEHNPISKRQLEVSRLLKIKPSLIDGEYTQKLQAILDKEALVKDNIELAITNEILALLTEDASFVRINIRRTPPTGPSTRAAPSISPCSLGDYDTGSSTATSDGKLSSTSQLSFHSDSMSSRSDTRFGFGCFLPFSRTTPPLA